MSSSVTPAAVRAERIRLLRSTTRAATLAVQEEQNVALTPVRKTARGAYSSEAYSSPSPMHESPAATVPAAPQGNLQQGNLVAPIPAPLGNGVAPVQVSPAVPGSPPDSPLRPLNQHPVHQQPITQDEAQRYDAELDDMLGEFLLSPSISFFSQSLSLLLFTSLVSLVSSQSLSLTLLAFTLPVYSLSPCLCVVLSPSLSLLRSRIRSIQQI
jgi:hypothetical protein